MIGAIVGDIVWSRFEFNNYKSKEFELFTKDCFATDDTIMTLAIAKAIMETSKNVKQNKNEYGAAFHHKLGELSVKYMQEIGRKYPTCGFGGMFFKWVFSANPEPYNSYGNGAAMRISPIGFIANNILQAQELAKTVTQVTHNHPEGIKGAQAVAGAVFMALNCATKREIKQYIIDNYYPLDFRIDDIRNTYSFNETCQETVPQAIECFLESHSFEDALRIGVSLGGDTDTICAITGAIAEAYYGAPAAVKEKALKFLDDELLTIYKQWREFVSAKYENIFL
ncbi:MAG: ADP-ribosylglycohydrolase family protein [Elusimicrobiota bacterium]|jgi:ADP-ribosylglycohydrolase|nr:ADP-ribosylglycohydrolase family protein [Elusimicrobiota bacterium]